MGYYVRSRSSKKSKPKWKLQFISYKKNDLDKKNFPNKTKKEWDISKDRWRALGFHHLMTIKEAKGRARQLNSMAFVKSQEVRIKKIQLEENYRQKKLNSVLPIEFVNEFEKRFIRVRDSETDNGKRKKSRALITWRAAQKLIVALQLDPS